jgi:hypothetical protein
MVRKRTKKAKEVPENELYILPSPTDEMKSFVTKFKVDMMEHVVSSIKFALENKLPLVEVFQFKNSPFVVTISEAEFDTNLSHIRKYYMDNEIYELCPRVEKLQEILKRKPNEKKQEDPENPDGPSRNSK